MIVRNEALVIRRCLDSVLAIIDCWVVVDTGSTDGTQAVVRSHLGGRPGDLYERPWRNFASNRTESLQLAKGWADYSLVIDADDALDFDKAFQLPVLDKDSYQLRIVDGSVSYQRTQIVRNALPWRYRGVLHEFIECEGTATSRDVLAGMRLQRHREGARARNTETYREDAVLLEQALASERDPFLSSRYTFYLAQSYRDGGETDRAIATYLKRARLEFWDQERYVSLYMAANLMVETARTEAEIVRAYREAIAICAYRAEAYHGLSHYYRSIERFEDGFQAARPALGLVPRSGDLFNIDWIFEYGLLDEYSINAYWAGHDLDSLEACETMLGSRVVPEDERERIETNAEFARLRLAKQGRLPQRTTIDVDRPALTDPRFRFGLDQRAK